MAQKRELETSLEEKHSVSLEEKHSVSLLKVHAEKIGVDIGELVKYKITDAQIQYLLEINRKHGFKLELFKILKPEIIKKYTDKPILKVISSICKLLGKDKIWDKLKKQFIRFLISKVDIYEKSDYAKIVFSLEIRDPAEIRSIMYAGDDSDNDSLLTWKSIQRYILTEEEENRFIAKVVSLRYTKNDFLINKCIEIFNFYIASKKYVDLYERSNIGLNKDSYDISKQFLTAVTDEFNTDYVDLVDNDMYSQFIEKYVDLYFSALRKYSSLGLKLTIVPSSLEAEQTIFYTPQPEVLNYITKVVQRRLLLNNVQNTGTKDKTVIGLINSLNTRFNLYSKEYNSALSLYFSGKKKSTKKETDKERSKKERFLYDKLLPLYQSMSKDIKREWKQLKTQLKEKNIDLYNFPIEIQSLETGVYIGKDLVKGEFVLENLFKTVFEQLNIDDTTDTLLDDSVIVPKLNKVIKYKIVYKEKQYQGKCVVVPETNQIGIILDNLYPERKLSLFINKQRIDTEIINVKNRSYVILPKFQPALVLVIKTIPENLRISDNGVTISNDNINIGDQVVCNIKYGDNNSYTMTNYVQEVLSEKTFPIYWKQILELMRVTSLPSVESIDITKYGNYFDNIVVKEGKLYSEYHKKQFDSGIVSFSVFREIDSSGTITKIDSGFIYLSIPTNLDLEEVVEFYIHGTNTKRKSRVRDGNLLIANPRAGDKVKFIDNDNSVSKGTILGYKSDNFAIGDKEIPFFNVVKVYKKSPVTFFTPTVTYDDVLSLEVDNYLRDIIVNTLTRKIDAILNSINEEYKKRLFLNFDFDLFLKDESHFVDFKHSVTRANLLKQKKEFIDLYTSLELISESIELTDLERINELRESEIETEKELGIVRDVQYDSKEVLQSANYFKDRMGEWWKHYNDVNFSPEAVIISIKELIPNFFQLSSVQVVQTVKTVADQLKPQENEIKQTQRALIYQLYYFLSSKSIIEYTHSQLSELYIQFIYEYISRTKLDFERFKQKMILKIIREYIKSFEYIKDEALIVTQAKELYDEYKVEYDSKKQKYDKLQVEYKRFEDQIQDSSFTHVVAFENSMYNSMTINTVKEYLSRIVNALIYIDDTSAIEEIKERRFDLMNLPSIVLNKTEQTKYTGVQNDYIFAIVDRYAYGRFQNVFKIDFSKAKRDLSVKLN
jgi:hypothetical protein